MDSKNGLHILSVDVAEVPSRQVEVISGISPKVKSKNKHIQNILIKLFGYKIEYKTVDAKVIEIKAGSIPLGFNGSITIDAGGC